MDSLSTNQCSGSVVKEALPLYWHFKATVTVAVSPQFFAWVFGLGNYVTITAPDNVVKQMKDMLEKVSKR